MEKVAQLLNPEKLFDSIRVRSFPYLNKCGELSWEESRYTTDTIIYWDLYYRDLCNIEKIIQLSRPIPYVNKADIYITLQRVYKHRISFLRRLKKLGIIDPLLFNVVGSAREGDSGLPVREWYGQYIRYSHNFSEFLGKRIYIPKIITECTLPTVN